VAGPSLDDPNFHRTVVLLLAAGAVEGALGLVLNRPNEIPVGTLLPGWEALAVEPDSVFVGGPVARDNVICLARLRPAYRHGFEGCSPVDGVDGLATLDLNRSPIDMEAGVEGVRLFSGYSGWASGQLDDELEAGGWLVVPSRIDDAFSPDPAGLWRRVLRRQGGRIAMYANAPPKLSLN
jgi:putative transcriptional regulator